MGTHLVLLVRVIPVLVALELEQGLLLPRSALLITRLLILRLTLLALLLLLLLLHLHFPPHSPPLLLLPLLLPRRLAHQDIALPLPHLDQTPPVEEQPLCVPPVHLPVKF